MHILDIVQAIQIAAAAASLALATLTPARLCMALKSAGNLVEPAEVEAVLAYATGEREYIELMCLSFS